VGPPEEPTSRRRATSGDCEGGAASGASAVGSASPDDDGGFFARKTDQNPTRPRMTRSRGALYADGRPMRRAAEPSRDLGPGEIELQALYSISVLAAFANMSRHRMARLLDSYGVKLLRSGRSTFVPISELERCVPTLFSSIVRVAGTKKIESPKIVRSSRASR
jgi:hypothetical protein